MASEFRQEHYTQNNPGYPSQPPAYQSGDAKSHPPPPPPPQQYVYVRQPDSFGAGYADSLRTAIPQLPMCLAVTYCILNCIIPGFGTILAGFSVLCCGNVGQSKVGKFGTFCINFWVGLAQLILSPFGVGWVWSIFWGYAFIAITADAQHQERGAVAVSVTQYNQPAVAVTTVPVH